MKCGNCGNEVEPGKVYCPVCGHEIQVVSDSGILEDDMLQELIETTEKTDNRPKTPRDDLKKSERKDASSSLKKKKTAHKTAGFFIIVAAFVIILIIVLCMVRTHSYGYLYERGKVAYNTGKFKEAKEDLEKAREKRSDSEEVYLLLGRTYLELGETQQAEQCLKQVIQWNKNSTDAYEALLELYKDDAESIRELKDSASASNKDVQELFSLYIADIPEASCEDGTYNEAIKVTLSAASGDKIFYTLDQSDPEKYGKRYEDVLEISKEGETVLKAVAQNSRGIYSDVLTVTYEIEYEAPDMPSAFPDGGNFTQPSQVTLTSESGTSIYYTWDGSIPDTSSQKYENPLDIPEGNNILSVVAVDNATGKMSGVLRSNFIYYPE